MTHEDYKELLAANALTALDVVEVQALAVHLEGCAECRREQGAWEQTASGLTFAAGSLEPSLQLRERLLARVRAEEHTLDRLEAGTTLRPHLEPGSVAADNSRVLAFDRRPPRNFWSSFGTPGAIAAMLVFFALVISLIALWQQNRSTQSELVRVSDEMQRTTAQLNRERAIMQLLTSPESRMAKLAGTNVAPGARAMLAYDKNGHAMLMARGLPAAPSGMAYQLWFIQDNKKMPGKVFTPDAAGNGMLEDEVPDSARGTAVFAVTLEPAAGVPSPTGSIYLLSG